ncbi:MAG: sulfur carrier protein ThiS [Bacteroidales bacterium]|jgi:thiamine biosynthesis protein ThiS|nr:sulfur carrier protein ThiS [Bacteroidales bacterium]
MKITLNNRPEEIPGEILTIREIMQYKKFSFHGLVVKINGTLIRKPEYDTSTVKDGDVVEIIHLISGG